MAGGHACSATAGDELRAVDTTEVGRRVTGPATMAERGARARHHTALSVPNRPPRSRVCSAAAVMPMERSNVTTEA